MSRRRSLLCSIKVAARSSKLSRMQVQEVALLYPDLMFEPVYVHTVGDLDRTTSLRALERSDFFTREVDALVLQGKCRLAIHSAKDLPDPLPAGLEVIALTRGLDPSDSLVLRELPLRAGMVIATSSVRREEAVRLLGLPLFFVDIRGTIEERLDKIAKGEVDGVVVATAALIRLGLTQLPRLVLPGETAPLQGRLAIVAREDDHEMKQVFGNENSLFGIRS